MSLESQWSPETAMPTTTTIYKFFLVLRKLDNLTEAWNKANRVKHPMRNSFHYRKPDGLPFSWIRTRWQKYHSINIHISISLLFHNVIYTCHTMIAKMKLWLLRNGNFKGNVRFLENCLRFYLPELRVKIFTFHLGFDFLVFIMLVALILSFSIFVYVFLPPRP